MSDERALELVSRQGFGQPKQYGPKAPTTVQGLLEFVHAARARGYATIDQVFAPGMTAMAAPVQRRNYPAIGVISIAGPAVRLDEKRMKNLGPALLAAAFELAEIAKAEKFLHGVLLRARQVGIGDDFVAIKHRPRPKGRAA